MREALGVGRGWGGLPHRGLKALLDGRCWLCPFLLSLETGGLSLRPPASASLSGHVPAGAARNTEDLNSLPGIGFANILSHPTAAASLSWSLCCSGPRHSDVVSSVYFRFCGHGRHHAWEG